MKMIAALKPVALIGLLALSNPAGGFAQNLIKMQNAGCTDGLAALANLVQVKINPATTPRNMVGKCDAQSVTIRSERAKVTIEIDRLKWNRDGLGPLADGKLPDQLKLELHGVQVTSAPEQEPAWAYLASEGAAGRKFDAKLAFAFAPESGTLKITSASLDFHNSNIVKLTAQLRGISATQPKNPELAALTMIVDDLMFTIHSGKGQKNPALALATKILQGKIPEGDFGGFKARATTYIAKELATVLNAESVTALKKMVSDLPQPKGGMLLHLDAAGGFSALRLGLLAKGNDPAQALEGVSVEIGYGNNLFDNVN